jgi:hypothetical protein
MFAEPVSMLLLTPALKPGCEDHHHPTNQREG